MTKKLHYNIKVTGIVQGVWYRKSARRKALELGISGFVRNEPNGSVYIEAEAEKEVLENLAAWCKVGPPGARVQRVEAVEADMKNFLGFEITR